MAKVVVDIRLLPMQFFQRCCMVEIVHNKVLAKMLPWERGLNPWEYKGYNFQNPVFIQILFLKVYMFTNRVRFQQLTITRKKGTLTQGEA